MKSDTIQQGQEYENKPEQIKPSSAQPLSTFSCASLLGPGKHHGLPGLFLQILCKKSAVLLQEKKKAKLKYWIISKTLPIIASAGKQASFNYWENEKSKALPYAQRFTN